MEFSIIAAVARDGSIGQEGGLPWGRIRADMGWFSWLTRASNPFLMAHGLIDNPVAMHAILITPADLRNGIIMGRTTFTHLPKRLNRREVIVLMHEVEDDYPIHNAQSFESGLRCAERLGVRNLFVCGGAQVYNEALQHQGLIRLYITEIDAAYPDADTWWPGTVEDLLWGNGIMYCPSKPGYEWHPWKRVKTSPWIETTNHPRLRFGIWERS